MTQPQAAVTIPLQKKYDGLKALSVSNKPTWKKLIISLHDETRFIAFEDILYCKSNSNYTAIYIREGKSYLCCKTLKEIESKLPPDTFFRIHHSYVVNLQYITAFKKQTAELEVNNQSLIPISRAKKAELYTLFNL